jgi:hypothetical protein
VRLPKWARESEAVARRCAADREFRMRVLNATMNAAKLERPIIVRAAEAWCAKIGKGRAA